MLSVNSFQYPQFKKNICNVEKSSPKVLFCGSNIAPKNVEALANYSKNLVINSSDFPHRIVPIKCDDEYKFLISKLFHFAKRERDKDGKLLDFRNQDNEKNIVLLGGQGNPYEKVPNHLRGLISYCGFSDISHDINTFLKFEKHGHLDLLESGSKSDKKSHLLIDADSKDVKSFIKCLDYSLSKLDEKYGVYRGFVYRGGLFEADGKQYYSTSRELVPFVQVESQGKQELQFHIIETQSGHKINEFQKEFYAPEGVQRYDYEKEILLPRDTIYEEVTNDEKYFEQRFYLADRISKYLQKTNEQFTFEDVWGRTKVWREK